MIRIILAKLGLQRLELVTDEEIRIEIDRISEERSRDIAARFTRGNVSIQNRDYVTRVQVDDDFGHANWRS